MMDTYTQPVTPKRRYRELEEKRHIVEETLAEGASVARIAGTHGVNANLVFNPAFGSVTGADGFFFRERQIQIAARFEF